MKKYENAFVEIVSLEESDVIVTSGFTLYAGDTPVDGDVHSYSTYFGA